MQIDFFLGYAKIMNNVPPQVYTSYLRQETFLQEAMTVIHCNVDWLLVLPLEQFTHGCKCKIWMLCILILGIRY